ncbi:MAG TPA: PepSY-associated TM helix domain-containing protein [Flavisolibacter sp.]|nr:PepSY-associated TM helix domain-containing protein [Flavisolibacter sp.]
MSTTKQQAKWIRIYRWLHRKLAVASFVFFIIIALTGLLLGIKKQTGLLAPTQKGSSVNLAGWLPVSDLQAKAEQYLRDSVSADLSAELDRIDIRPGKGIAKFIYKHHYHGLQLDCTTGDLLSVETRSSDFIEAIHDGSIVDRWLGTSGEQVKVTYMVITGVSMLLLILSGMWLWYGPKRIRAQKRSTN